MKKVGWLMGVWCFLVVAGIVMAVEPQTQKKPVPLTMVTEVITPSYISPSELLDFLGVTTSGGVNSFFCDFPNHDRPVQIRCNDAANLVMLTGMPEDIAVVKELIKSADIPPRQIIIETQIIELDNRRLDDLGIDWEDLLRSSGLTLYHNYNRDKVSRDQKDKAKSGPMTSEHETEQTLTQTSKDTRVSGQLRFDQFLNIIAENRAGTIRNAPRIVTINNRPAKILDGERVTYVTRYSSYTNLFETQTMDAGLSLYCVPSIGNSGYITLDVTAELTTLGESISGSPSKDGQILENTAVVKDGDTFLLGGLNRSVDYVTKRKVPVLGTILPFLFSRKITTKTTYQVFILLTPKVIDLEPQVLDESLKEFMQQ
jgi:type II secretory pathway component GspD/PulD (secretin)